MEDIGEWSPIILVKAHEKKKFFGAHCKDFDFDLDVHLLFLVPEAYLNRKMMTHIKYDHFCELLFYLIIRRYRKLCS